MVRRPMAPPYPRLASKFRPSFYHLSAQMMIMPQPSAEQTEKRGLQEACSRGVTESGLLPLPLSLSLLSLAAHSSFFFFFKSSHLLFPSSSSVLRDRPAPTLLDLILERPSLEKERDRRPETESLRAEEGGGAGEEEQGAAAAAESPPPLIDKLANGDAAIPSVSSCCFVPRLSPLIAVVFVSQRTTRICIFFKERGFLLFFFQKKSGKREKFSPSRLLVLDEETSLSLSHLFLFVGVLALA